ncbi:MAG: hypothetical protein IPO43_07170 [Rhodoferax sp.]|nr:hypothetical protein [Rhodoferax sp.]
MRLIDRRHYLGWMLASTLLPQRLLAQTAAVWTDADLAQALALRNAAMKDSLAYQLVDSLVTEVGSRPAGSAADPRAVEWALAKLKGLGFAKVRAEPVAVKAWRQGPVSMDILAPFPHRLVATALGNSVGTPAGGLEAEVAYYSDLAALKADTSERAKGRIVFINNKTERSRDGSGYGQAVMARVAGAAEAARRGAVAVAIRSIGTDRDRLAHTGGMRYDPQLRQVPSLAVSIPDAELIERLQRYGKPLVMRLQLQTETELNASSHNVIAEVPGTDLADEVVLLGRTLTPGTSDRVR